MNWIKVVGVFFLIALLSQVSVEAKEAGALFLSPPFKSVEIGKNDKKVEFNIEIGYGGSLPEIIDLTVVDFGSLDETGGVAFLTTGNNSGERKYALASWISLEKDFVVVQEGKKQTVKVTILNKESLMPGGHYGAILATLKTGNTSYRDNVAVNQSLASLIYVQKTGGEIKNLRFNSFQWKVNWLFLPKVVDVRFENTGNVHLVPRGKIEIKNSEGLVVTKGIINQESGLILPESYRIFKVDLTELANWKWPGKYSINISYRYDGKEDFEHYQKDFYYIGKTGLIVAMVFLAILGAIVIIRLRKNRV